MKLLLDFLPLAIFFAVFKFFGIFAATAVSIGASAVQLAAYRLIYRRFEPAAVVTFVILLGLGGLTLLSHDSAFIMWKPTLVYWVFAAIMLGSRYIGDKTVIERLLGRELVLPAPLWRRLNLSWVVFFLLLGALNLYVAFYYAPDLAPQARQAIWVNFKVFVAFGLTLAFALAQALVIASCVRKTKTSEHDDARTEHR